MTEILKSVLLVSGILSAPALQGVEGDKEGIRFFEKHIRPILVEHCHACHSRDSGKSKGDLLLDSREGVRKGGELGPALIPGDPDASILYRAISYSDDDLKMPPKKRLPPQAVTAIRKWIDMGAPDPRKGSVKPPPPPIDFEKARKHWSFQPITLPPLPEVSNPDWVLEPLDRFILARLDREGLAPVGPAKPERLLRRISYDLTGLPPTPEQQDRFLSAAAKDFNKAYGDVVEELLQSPGFGERWGRHWLDVVHYAETIAKPRNFVNPLMWKYRDYVIDAYNRDLPFDRFLTEQLAGDLLPAEDLAERRRQMVATGMLLTGQRASNGPGKSAEAKEFLADDIDGQINVVGHAVLGLSVSCARCHDHKFDPIPTRDYYALAGIFRSTSSYNAKVLPPAHPDAPGGPKPIASARFVAMPGEIAGLEKASALRVRVEGLRESLRRQEDALKKLSVEGVPRVPANISRIRQLEKKIEDIRSTLGKLGPTMAPIETEVVSSVNDHPRPVAQPLFIKGDSANPGPVVPRGFLQVIPTPVTQPPMPDDQSGRVELAHWLTAPENPLVARVYVNRVWHHLFGIGLVESVDDFGMMGQPPSHPLLLDYLAFRFRREGWSTKSLIRMIVLSRTYRLGSTPQDEAISRDPDGRLRWRMVPRRLEVEAIRDSLLAASGQLLRGSPGPSDAARKGFHQVGRVAVSYDVPRRTVYLSILRDALPHELELFDFPDPAIVKGRRSTSNMPTQALFMMNSGLVMEASRKTAGLLLQTSSGSVASRVDAAVRRILGRPAMPAEIEHLEVYLEESLSSGTPAKEAWSRLCQLLFSSMEFRHVW